MFKLKLREVEFEKNTTKENKRDSNNLIDLNEQYLFCVTDRIGIVYILWERNVIFVC